MITRYLVTITIGRSVQPHSTYLTVEDALDAIEQMRQFTPDAHYQVDPINIALTWNEKVAAANDVANA